MANKQLTAKVRLNTTQAEQKLKRLALAIDAINKVVGKQTNAYNAVNTALGKNSANVTKVKKRTDELANSANKVNTNFQKTNSTLGSLGNKLKGIAATYLGVMGAKALINTSDTITSAENRINTLNGFDSKATQLEMDKMYASAQKVRMSYADMIANASKSMTLAGDAFQDNMDNAIRFQEIMSEAYTLGGASAAEQSTSMYQMIQALGAGTLAGDELRSVREGAPLAYKAIEEFAQGVYKTEESLKELASQGKISSDMVVAAVMQAGDKMDAQFEKTAMTFGQAWEQIKNAAIKAFEPALQTLNKMLNSDAGKAAIEGIGKALVVLGNVVSWVFSVLGTFFDWCYKNWEWLKYVVGTVLGVIIALLIKQAAIAIWNALVNLWCFITQYWGLLLIVAGIMAILYVYEIWRQGTITTTEAIVYCLLIIAAVALIAGIILMSIPLLILAVVIAVIALIIMYFAEFCGAINVGIKAIVNAWFWLCNLVLGAWNWCVALLKNIGKGVANFFIACFDWICAAGYNAFAGIANFGIALKNAIVAIADNIGIAFQNAWIWAQNTFWEFIASVIDGVSKLEPVINGIAKLLGKDGINFGELSESIRGKKKEYVEFVSVSDAWNSGMNTFQYKDLGEAWSNGMNTYQYENLGEAWNKGWNTYDTFESGWASDAYNSGYEWGQGIENAINDWGSQFQNKESSYGGLGTDIANMLGGTGLPSVADPTYDVSGAYDQPAIEDLIKGIADDTSSIDDSLDLTNDDFDYLRKLAEMEWRNEFTTAEIKVDMTNNNMVNGERDLDGIVSYLSDVLKEEMTNVAYGVHY